MDLAAQHDLLQTRRQFFGRSALGIGTAALAGLLNGQAIAASGRGVGGLPNFAGRAKRIIYLFQSGAPSQIDLFDYKPTYARFHGTQLPASIRGDQRLTGMTAGQATFPVAGPIAPFHRHGQSGTWVSDLLPYTAGVVDDLCVVTSMHTEAINHDPAITFFQTGHQQPGRPSLGAWLSYGLGNSNRNLPAFVVLLSRNQYAQAQPLYTRLWGAGFLPSSHQGVKFRSGADPVLYLGDPAGASWDQRRKFLDSLAQLNQIQMEAIGDPEILARIEAYEMAYRMQVSVPDLMDLSSEPDSTFALYGPDARIPGTHAANCLLARRLAERDVRFIQLYHRDWDHHSNLPVEHPKLCAQTDRGSAALVADLKQRGLLEDTLVIWGGEFGRTIYSQGALQGTGYGRDHHPRCFTMWLAGGGIRGGQVWGQTDDYSYNIVRDPVHIHDLHATTLYLMGIDHKKLTFRFQGRDYRLTDVHGHVVGGILA